MKLFSEKMKLLREVKSEKNRLFEMRVTKDSVPQQKCCYFISIKTTNFRFLKLSMNDFLFGFMNGCLLISIVENQQERMFYTS